MKYFIELRNYRPDNLQTHQCQTSGKRRPYIDIGEYLPSFDNDEIEFARINLASTTGDVISLRIRQKKKNYYINIVDEYEARYIRYKRKYDAIPTQGEIIDIITRMIISGERQPYMLAIIEYNEFKTVEEINDFVDFDSSIYPNLSELYIEYLIQKGYIKQEKTDQNKLNDIDLVVLSDLIKNSKKRSDWDSLMGTICFNIWNNSSEAFFKYQDLKYINISFLYTLNVFQKWNKIYLSKKYDIGAISKDASPFVVSFSSKLLDYVPKLKESIGIMNESNSYLSIFNFITIFSEALLETSEFKKENINPLDYFQRGVEVLCLFIYKLKILDKDFYNDLMVVGEFDKKVDDIIQQINSLEDTEA
jgi:hypothetical protein